MEHAIILVYQHQLQKCQIIYCKYIYRLLHHFGMVFQAENHNEPRIFVGLYKVLSSYSKADVKKGVNPAFQIVPETKVGTRPVPELLVVIFL